MLLCLRRPRSSRRRFRHLCFPELQVSWEPRLVLELPPRERESRLPPRDFDLPRPFPFPFEPERDRILLMVLERDLPRIPAIASAWRTFFSCFLFIFDFALPGFPRCFFLPGAAFALATPPPGVMTLLSVCPRCKSSWFFRSRSLCIHLLHAFQRNSKDLSG